MNQTCIALMDETGADGFHPGAHQPFYSHGVLWIEGVSRNDLNLSIPNVRRSLGLPTLHVADANFEQKLEICKAALDWLRGKSWGLLDYTIQKSFFPVGLYTEILFLYIRHNGLNLPFKEAEPGSGALIDLIAYNYFTDSARHFVWDAFDKGDAWSLESFTIDFALEAEKYSAGSAFCNLVHKSVEHVTREGHIFQSVLHSTRYRAPYRRPSIRALLGLLFALRHDQVDISEIIHDQSAEIRNFIDTERIASAHVPFLNRLRFSSSEDKDLIWLIDAAMWVTKEYHAQQSGFTQRRRYSEISGIADRFAPRSNSLGNTLDHARRMIEKYGIPDGRKSLLDDLKNPRFQMTESGPDRNLRLK